MAWITKRPNGHTWIGFRFRGRQYTLRLQVIPDPQADEIKRHIDELLQAYKFNRSPSDGTGKWVQTLQGPVADRLAKAGLILPRSACQNSNETADLYGTEVGSQLRERTDSRPGVVYFLEAVGIGKVKIGWSSMVTRRITELKTMSPVLLRPLAFRGGSKRDESDLHRKFRAFHTWGEWYFLCSEVLEEIAKEGTFAAGDDWRKAVRDAAPKIPAAEYFEIHRRE